MRLFADLGVFRQLAEQAARPNQVGSFLQLCRRARTGDDTARRALDRLKCEFNDPLLLIQDRHASLTGPGRELLQLAIRLSALAENHESAPDVLTVECDTFLAASLLPQAFARFLDLFASMVQARIFPLQAERVKQNIHDGVTAFGVTTASAGDIVPVPEMLGPKVEWVLAVPQSHQLAGVAGPVSAGNLAGIGRVFLPTSARDWPGMDVFLKAVPTFNRIECDALLAVRLATAGLGGSGRSRPFLGR